MHLNKVWATVVFFVFISPGAGPELKRFFIVFVAPAFWAAQMVNKWFSKGTDTNDNKMMKTFLLATKPSRRTRCSSPGFPLPSCGDGAHLSPLSDGLVSIRHRAPRHEVRVHNVFKGSLSW